MGPFSDLEKTKGAVWCGGRKHELCDLEQVINFFEFLWAPPKLQPTVLKTHEQGLSWWSGG